MMLVDDEPKLPRKRYGTRWRLRPVGPMDLGAIAIVRINRKQREVPLSYSGHVRGWHPVRPGHGSIQFESLIERDTISALARFSDVARIVSQPITVEYRIGRKIFRYTPDFLVRFYRSIHPFSDLGSGRQIYIECKPHDLVEHERHVLDRHFCALRLALDVPVLLVTDRDLKQGILAVRHG